MANPKAAIEITAVDKTAVAFQRVQENLRSMQSASGALTTAMARLAPLVGAATFTAFTKNVIDSADAMNDLSARTGITVERLSAWKLATAQSGTDIAALASAISKASKYIVEHGDSLEKMGISAKTAEGVILQLSDVIAAMPSDDPNRVTLAIKVLGKNAAELLPLLSQGSDELQRQLNLQESMISVTTELAQNSDKFNDELGIMAQRLSSGAGVIVGEMLPALTKFLQLLNGTRASKDIAVDLFKELQDASSKLDELKTKKNDGGVLGFFVTEDDIARQEKYIQDVRKRLGAAVKDANEQLARDAKSEEARNSRTKRALSSVNSVLAKDGANAKTGKTGNAVVDDTMRDLAKLMQDAQAAVAPAQTMVEKLQAQLNAYTALDPAVKTYVQGLIDQARAQEQATEAAKFDAEFSERLREGDERELELMEEIAAAEQERIQSMQQKAQAYLELIDPSLKLLNIEAELQQMVSEGVLSTEEASAAYKKLAEDTDEVASMAKDLGLTFSSAFEDAVLGAKDFRSVLAGVAEDMAKLFLRKKVTEPLFDAVGSVFDSGGGFGDFFSGLGFASGGRPPVGQASLVGEAGPELFVPDSAGTIIPNKALGGGNNVTVNIDARGADSAAAARIESIAKALPGMIKSQLVEERRSGGLLAA